MFDDTVDMLAMAHHAMEFCAHENCGKCTPCRVGAVRGRELLEAIAAGRGGTAALARLAVLCEILRHGTLCGMGGMAPFPVMSALEHFPGDFRRRNRWSGSCAMPSTSTACTAPQRTTPAIPTTTVRARRCENTPAGTSIESVFIFSSVRASWITSWSPLVPAVRSPR